MLLIFHGKAQNVFRLIGQLAKMKLTLGEIKERMDTARAQEVYFRTNQQN